MIENGAALRIATPIGQEAQLVFPWALEGSTRTLAIPPGDAVRWRLRMDIRRPRVVVLDTNWITDPRYRRLREAARAEGAKFMLVWACIAAMAYELVVNDAAIGLGIPGNCYTELGRERWHAPAEELEDFETAARLALASGIFITLDAADQIAAGAYACVRARTHACVDRTGPDRTGPDKTGPDRSGAAGLLREAAPGGGAGGERPTAGGARQVVPIGVGIVIDSANPAAALAALGECCRGWRASAKRSAFPVDPRDFADIREAFESAVAMGRLEQMIGELRKACLEVDGGNGIHWRLKNGAWI